MFMQNLPTAALIGALLGICPGLAAHAAFPGDASQGINVVYQTQSNSSNIDVIVHNENNAKAYVRMTVNCEWRPTFNDKGWQPESLKVDAFVYPGKTRRKTVACNNVYANSTEVRRINIAIDSVKLTPSD